MQVNDQQLALLVGTSVHLIEGDDDLVNLQGIDDPRQPRLTCEKQSARTIGLTTSDGVEACVEVGSDESKFSLAIALGEAALPEWTMFGVTGLRADQRKAFSTGSARN